MVHDNIQPGHSATFFVTIVLDGVGIGEQPDAGEYGDEGSDTLGHVCRAIRPRLPNLERMGLGCIVPLEGIRAVEKPMASYGKMQEISAGKDSTTGHWELAGLVLDRPFPTFPEGFPASLIHHFEKATGVRGVLGNRADSGTAIIEALGARHQDTGFPIVYTSADSVFQVAAHKDVISLEELYRLCEIAREQVCVGEAAVGRVIARPFIGSPGFYQRVSAERKDFSLQPPQAPIQASLQQAGVQTISVGKVYDLFGGKGFDRSLKTRSNEEGLSRIFECMADHLRAPRPTFVWANLVDFDQEYGHRNDPEGFAAALEAFDSRLPDLLKALPANGVLLITADHGNDPTTPGTDHSREYVPLLVYRPEKPVISLGLRLTFADHAATLGACFGVDASAGTAF